MKGLRRAAFAAGLAGCLLGGPPSAAAEGRAEEDPVLCAMRAELERSQRELRLESMAGPYFLAYRVDDGLDLFAEASFGALLSSWTDRDRLLTLELRVGDATFDNANYLPRGASPQTRAFELPLEGDCQALRRAIWLATDIAYKHALEMLGRKRAALQNRAREDVPDFTAEEPRARFFEDDSTVPDVAAVEALARELSASFKDAPAIQDSRVRANVGNVFSRYVNTEGSAYAQSQSAAMVRALAKTQAPDGAVLQDFEAFHARDWADLPSRPAMAERIRAMAAMLARRQGADMVERYNGPVLFEGQAAAQLFAQVMTPRLLAIRAPAAPSSLAAYASSLRNPFVDKIGARVLPRLLSLRDDPSIDRNAGGALLGGYAVDADGVPAAPTTLVERGVLRTLLAGRNPIAGIARSTGNQRGELLMPSNLLLEPSRGLAADELRAELLALAAERGAEYAIVLRRLADPRVLLDFSDRPARQGDQARVERPTRAFKVYPDGREEPIRKAELAGFAVSDFRDIVAVSQRVTNHALDLYLANAYRQRAASARYGTTGGFPLVSISTPDLLFEEVTLRKPLGNVGRRPIAGHPYF